MLFEIEKSNYKILNKKSNIEYDNSLFLQYNEKQQFLIKNKNKDYTYIKKYDLFNDITYLKQIFNENENVKTILNNLNNYDCLKDDETIFKEYTQKLNELQNGENLFMFINNYCNSYSIEFLYFFSSFFEKTIIMEGNILYGKNYKSQFNKNIEFNNNNSIEPKPKLNELLKYLMNVFQQKNNNLQFIIDNDEEKYLLNMKNKLTNLIVSGNFLNELEKNKLLIKIKKHLIQYFKSIFIDNTFLKVSSNIKMEEGNFISDTIQNNNFTKCLEVGMACGISALYILQNENVFLTSIDPFQSTQWKNTGVELIKSCNFSNRHILIEKKSYEALPSLLGNFYDFIFIDGFHTFDYTLIDFFYSDLILNKNGIIIIDDALHEGVKKCILYIETNYSHYKKLPSPQTVACFLKINNDKREWNFHKNF